MTKVFEYPVSGREAPIRGYEVEFLSPNASQKAKYVGISCFVFDNGDMCEYGRTREGNYEFLGLVFTDAARKACVLESALKRLEDDKELEPDKEVRLQTIEGLRVLLTRK